MKQKATLALSLAGLAVTGVVASFLVSTPSFAGKPNPKPNGSAAQWSSPSVNLSAIAGTATQLTMTLSASGPTPAARVIISKKLRPFVTVSPTATPALVPGGSVTFTLTLSSPTSATPKTTSGFLKLRALQDRTADDDAFCDGPIDDVRIARRLPITATITWASVSIPGVGSLSVPPMLVASVDGNSGELSLIPDNAGIDGGGIGVSVDANPNQLLMTEYYTGDPGADLGASVGTTSVAGRVGYVFEPHRTMSCDVIVALQRSDGSFVKIDDYGCAFQSNGIFDAVVRSIQLTN